VGNNILKKKQVHPQVKTSLWLKIVLIFLGLSLALVITEAGLRISGFIILSLQEYRNIHSLSRQGSYRILCLGESTTQEEYPRFLEEILNQRDIGVKFSVIDKGKAATNTTIILNQVELYLDKYKPDMVVAMMGVNDSGPHMIYEKPSFSKSLLFLRSFKTYKLMRFLWLRIINKVKETGLYRPHNNQQSSCERKSSFLDIVVSKAFAQEENNPDNDKAYLELGLSYRSGGQLKKAEECLKKSLELNPNNEKAYVALGLLYKDQSELKKAEECLKKALELNPNNERACIELRWLCQGPGAFPQIEKYLNKALELNPRNYEAYVELGLLYRDHGDFKRAAECLGKAMELNPKLDRAYLDFGWLYLIQGKLPQAEEYFRKGLEMCPQKTKLYSALNILYGEMGKATAGRDYSYRSEESKPGNLYTETAQNYRRLKEILDKRNVKLVCVQYPLRDLDPLKRVFDDPRGIIFVDNQQSFKQAVSSGGYKLYFRDMFAGDFGHCTNKGNRLLAQNIADAILFRLFHKK